MKIHHLYEDETGQSHFEDLEIALDQPTKGGLTSKKFPVTGLIFRQAPADYDLDWHPAPRRQYIVNLDNGAQLTASDGETRIIGAGEIVLVEDTTGRGHLSKAVNEQVRHCLFITLD